MNEQYVITISHQLGCGGAEIGKNLSELLSIPFIDRQILKQASEYLSLPESDIEDREERLTSFWQTITRAESLGNPLIALGTEYLPSDRELFELESEFIEQIANKSSAIILGRGGRYILRDFPRQFSVLIYADMEERVRRVSQLYHTDDRSARKIIEKNDRDRDAYMKAFTKFDWLNARIYDICINTSSIGIGKAVEIIKSCLEFKLGI